ncbi:Sortilin, neurotensin receptor 3 [Tenacibaculum sp. MAR_2009_124]|uniref:WD40/YVTN/BNR-like repeat-containing protein n=1 Tax=Tenacibaculum sp. MAR_2009_124 TaxID=1250059 RepID=UPI00089C6591|nr:YCF48-related protein [Tenacibaculum sp. MAR_2009_124]SEB80470.1 Sortilin, neurotensin receptor 3 [Tenacibaculum sp. MAR_2009_124]
MKTLKSLAFTLLIIFISSCSNNDDNNNMEDPTNETPDNNGNNFTIEKIAVPSELTLQSVDFFENQKGFIASGKAYPAPESEILRSLDGGKTWTKVYANNTFYINKIHIKSENKIYAVTNNGTIVISNNGGNTWTLNETFKNRGYYMTDIYFTDENNAYIVGQRGSNTKGFILKTENNGNSWSDLEASNNNPNLDYTEMLTNNILRTITYYPPTDALIFGGGIWSEGKISIKNNNFWDVTNSVIPTKIMDLSIKDGLLVAGGNNGQTNSTSERGGLCSYDTNSGVWSSIDYNATNKIVSVEMKENTIVIAGRNKSNNLSDGEFLSYSKDEGQNWNRIPHEYVTAEWNDVFAISQTEFLVIGYNGLLIKLTIN